MSAVWLNLTLHHRSLPSPKNTFVFHSVWASCQYPRALIWRKKNFLIWFSLLFPQEEWKEDDEHFANHVQIYVSRTSPKAKISALCAEYPMSWKLHLSERKTYFSQFIDKFLKIEEVEYLIHYVKFKMWPALFYVSSLCFPNIFECWC